MITQSDRDAANKALDIAFRGDTSSIDDDMAQLFASHRAELLGELKALVTAVRFADPPKMFNGVECHEARVPVAFIEGAEAAITKATL